MDNGWQAAKAAEQSKRVAVATAIDRNALDLSMFPDVRAERVAAELVDRWGIEDSLALARHLRRDAFEGGYAHVAVRWDAVAAVLGRAYAAELSNEGGEHV